MLEHLHFNLVNNLPAFIVGGNNANTLISQRITEIECVACFSNELMTIFGEYIADTDADTGQYSCRNNVLIFAIHIRLFVYFFKKLF